MIKAYFYRNSENKIVKFLIKGHAGYDESGKDIVCASVTAVVFTAIAGLKNVADIDVVVQYNDGSMFCILPSNIEEKKLEYSAVILDTTYVGLRQIESKYGKYIKVFNKEEV